MERVIIGMDPHKRSTTIEARDPREVLRATGTFPTTNVGYRAMLRFARRWPDRIWAIEGGTALAGRWPSGYSPTGSECWMCRPSWPPGCGCSTPGRAVRPTPPMRTRW